MLLKVVKYVFDDRNISFSFHVRLTQQRVHVLTRTESKVIKEVLTGNLSKTESRITHTESIFRRNR
jgi:hypothetical protein